jgi:hypothetical protein
MVVHTCNTSTREDPEFKASLGLHSKTVSKQTGNTEEYKN